MTRNLPLMLGIGFVLLLLVMNSMFIVRQDRQAIVLRFGEYTNAINVPGADQPGLYFKLPFVETVIIYDRRNIGLTLEGQPIVASDQERLIVDAVVRCRGPGPSAPVPARRAPWGCRTRGRPARPDEAGRRPGLHRRDRRSPDRRLHNRILRRYRSPDSLPGRALSERWPRSGTAPAGRWILQACCSPVG
jgi:hypothetical protein